MASSPEIGLELPIGVTDQRAVQSVVRMVKRIEQESRKAEVAAVKANEGITRSFTNMSRQSRAQIQNVSYQLQDVFVQIAGGQGVTRALSQQMPQLLGGFGAFGAILGTVAAVAIPLAGSMLSLGEETKVLEDATKNAESALKAWREAADNANLSASDLTVRYGEAAGAARELLGVIAQTAETQALVAQREAVAALQTEFKGLSNLVESYAVRLADGDFFGAQDMSARIQDEYAMTRQEAERLIAVIGELNSTNDAAQRNSLLQEMAQIMSGAVDEGGNINGEMVTLVQNAANAGLAVVEIGNAASGASGQVAALTSDMANLAAQANSAAAALGAAGVFVGSDGSVQTGARGKDASTDWRFEDPNKDYDTLAERRAREAAAKAAADARANRAGGGGGGRKSSGGGSGRAGRAEQPFFENIERDLVGLERQLTLIGKTAEETATLETRWKLLDEAKKRGLTVDAEMNAQIDAQAAKMGALTAELERGELAQQQFEDAVDGIADAMAGALVAGESLREGLAQVFKQIASDILTSGIRNALSGQFNAFGGGSSLLGNLFGGFGGDKLTGAMRGAGLPASFDGGGFTGYGARSGGIDGKGGFPAILHPNETVIDHTKGQRAGGTFTFAPTINVGGNVTQDDIARIHETMAVERRNFVQNVRKAQGEISQRYS